MTNNPHTDVNNKNESIAQNLKNDMFIEKMEIINVSDENLNQILSEQNDILDDLNKNFKPYTPTNSDNSVTNSSENAQQIDDFDHDSNNDDKDDFIDDENSNENSKDNTLDEIELVRRRIEEDLNVYDVTQPNIKDINKRNSFFKQNLDLEFFFKNQSKLYESSTIITNMPFNELFFQTETDNILLLLTLIRDKVHQLYIDLTKPNEMYLQRAKELIKNNIKIFEGHDAPEKEVYDAYMEDMQNHAHIFVSFVKNLPGFNNICQKDLTSIINGNLPNLLGFKITKLYINGESYFCMKNNLQLTRDWHIRLFGEAHCNAIFEFHNKLSSLKLTNQEMSLLIPFILTSMGKIFVS